VGKHCGFVQFVRKADAEMAIEKMQGFPIGGSRIRLSWGRSQCELPWHVRVVCTLNLYLLHCHR
jgi:RNA recognition motif-containing protein